MEGAGPGEHLAARGEVVSGRELPSIGPAGSLHIDTAETTTTTVYDKLTVAIGATTLATYSNLNHNTGYSPKTLNASTFAGQTVTIKFTGTEDSQKQTSFVIDDTALTLS